jgi:hypothetical protein
MTGIEKAVEGKSTAIRESLAWMAKQGVTMTPCGPRALLPPCRRAYLYRPMKVGTMVSTARRASPTMSSA